MHVPPIDSVEGTYWYLIALLMGLVLVIALYITGIAVGSFPDFTQLF